MGFDYTRSRTTADRAIKKFGGRAILRRKGAADRFVSACEASFTAIERMGNLVDPQDVLFLISALDPDTGEPLTVPPDRENDILITLKKDGTEDKRYNISKPPSELKPADIIIYWELSTRNF